MFFAIQAATDAQLLRRSCESLLGICSGLLADGRLDDQEILFLDTWLAEHSAIANTWPGEVLYERIHAILADGVIDEKEREISSGQSSRSSRARLRRLAR